MPSHEHGKDKMNNHKKSPYTIPITEIKAQNDHIIY